jgi:hypothetical protein
MATRYMVFGSASLWLALFVVSFFVFDSIGSIDGGSGGDLDGIVSLLTWQAGAMAAAVTALAFMLRHRGPRGLGVSLAGIGPLAVMAVELVLAVALAMWLVTRDPHAQIERLLYPDSASASISR